MKPYNISIFNTKVNRGEKSVAFCAASGWPVPNITMITTDSDASDNSLSVVEVVTRTTTVAIGSVTENTTVECEITNVEGMESRAASASIYCECFLVESNSVYPPKRMQIHIQIIK